MRFGHIGLRVLCGKHGEVVLLMSPYSIKLPGCIVGSYDHTVRLFDTRCNTSVLRCDNGSPVESVVMFPGGGIVASAGHHCLRCYYLLDSVIYLLY